MMIHESVNANLKQFPVSANVVKNLFDGLLATMFWVTNSRCSAFQPLDHLLLTLVWHLLRGLRNVPSFQFVFQSNTLGINPCTSNTRNSFLEFYFVRSCLVGIFYICPVHWRYVVVHSCLLTDIFVIPTAGGVGKSALTIQLIQNQWVFLKSEFKIGPKWCNHFYFCSKCFILSLFFFFSFVDEYDPTIGKRKLFSCILVLYFI